MDVHLRELRYFVAAAEELHVTRAAERLFVSQPALSKQLRALERQVGCTLFERVPSGLALTRQGEALLPVARDLLARWDEGLDLIRQAAPTGTLVVGLQTAVGRGIQAEALRSFRERMPGWVVSLRVVGWDDASVGLADGSSDVAFLWLPAPEGIATFVLSTERRFVCMPEGHPLAGREEIAFAELADEPLVALPVAAGPLREFWLGRPDAIVGAEASSADEVFEAVLAGLGVVLLAEGNAELYKRPGLVSRPVSGLPPARLAIAWRAADRRPAVTAFLQSLLPGDHEDRPRADRT
ncbi:LysR family transcriptional regulator [Nonomuraea sp. NPDC049152]|uniref:LysR family transcriptional regulator n=1 Tax=Nonomuraea sp. NPDC049152 TaxID=3154350 RepID=UPI0033EF594B